MAPVVARIGGIAITPFGVAVIVALVLGWGLGQRWAAPRIGASARDMGLVLVFVHLGALLGSRLGFAAAHVTDVRDVMAFAQGGLDAGGTVAGASVGLVLAVRGNELWRWSDALAPVALVEAAVLRNGSYLLGSDYGRPLSGEAPGWLRAWGTYPRWDDGLGSPAWAEHVERGLVASASPVSLPVHPIPLYESLALALAAGAAVFVVRRFERGGLATTWALLAFVGVRFALAGLRG
ncbi:MAG: prolipoprotein diacylglyceryl transferase family protein [Myxococcota bacterium]